MTVVNYYWLIISDFNVARLKGTPSARSIKYKFFHLQDGNLDVTSRRVAAANGMQNSDTTQDLIAISGQVNQKMILFGDTRDLKLFATRLFTGAMQHFDL